MKKKDVGFWAKLIYTVIKKLTGGKVKIGDTTINLPSENNSLPRRDENPLGLR